MSKCERYHLPIGAWTFLIMMHTYLAVMYLSAIYLFDTGRTDYVLDLLAISNVMVISTVAVVAYWVIDMILHMIDHFKERRKQNA